MKKITSVLLILSLILIPAALSSCSGGDKDVSGSSGKLRIVTTIFPIYDWVRSIAGDDTADVTMLLDSGADLHNFQPAAADIIEITNCDLFIYVGGESDEWVEDILNSTDGKDVPVLNLMETLGEQAKEEELAEGMEAEEEEEEAEDADAGPEYDEHVWLSVRNAQLFVREIADRLAALDTAHSALYGSNADAYIEKLAALDSAYREAVDNAAVKTLVFGDRFPFRYLTDDYGLQYYAAFIGCSAETEASFATISFLAGKVDELGLRYVLTLEGTNHKIAETVIRTTAGKDQTVLSMDSMQSVTSGDLQSGISYLGIMESNLSVLKQALSNKAGE